MVENEFYNFEFQNLKNQKLAKARGRVPALLRTIEDQHLLTVLPLFLSLYLLMCASL